MLTKIAIGDKKDVDLAVKAAQKAFETTWGLNCPGYERGRLLMKLATLMEDHADELAAIECLDNGMCFSGLMSSAVPPPAVPSLIPIVTSTCDLITYYRQDLLMGEEC